MRSRISAMLRGSGSIFTPPIMDLGFVLPGEMVHALGAEDMMVRLDGCRLSITCRERKTVITPHLAPSEQSHPASAAAVVPGPGARPGLPRAVHGIRCAPRCARTGARRSGCAPRW